MQNSFVWLDLSLGSMLEVLVLKDAAECTSQRLKWTSGSQVMIIFGRSVARPLARSLDRSLDRSLGRSTARTIARSLARSVARSLDRSIARSLDRSIISEVRFWHHRCSRELFNKFDVRLKSLRNWDRTVSLFWGILGDHWSG